VIRVDTMEGIQQHISDLHPPSDITALHTFPICTSSKVSDTQQSLQCMQQGQAMGSLTPGSVCTMNIFRILSS